MLPFHPQHGIAISLGQCKLVIGRAVCKHGTVGLRNRWRRTVVNNNNDNLYGVITSHKSADDRPTKLVLVVGTSVSAIMIWHSQPKMDPDLVEHL